MFQWIKLLSPSKEWSLHDAVMASSFERVLELIDKGDCINRKDSVYQWSLLHWCAQLDQTADKSSIIQAKIAKLLIDRGLNYNYRAGHFRDTPLHVAAQWGSYAVAQVLINAGSNVNAKSRDGRTPLSYAIDRPHSFSDGGWNFENRQLTGKLIFENGGTINERTSSWRPWFKPGEVIRGLNKDEILSQNK
jgi:ankyrin repeat protein